MRDDKQHQLLCVLRELSNRLGDWTERDIRLAGWRGRGLPKELRRLVSQGWLKTGYKSSSKGRTEIFFLTFEGSLNLPNLTVQAVNF